ncbi:MULTISPECIES: 4Fe-4S dicluster domain-containing protein [Ferrimonas]|uniref:4Fe-4S dicluster domain-containing protein n=1 Tax=Ferrimonas TaxID=44011 RepID=UPI0004153661|nr:MULTISPECIES: 4Fe-4S dicluster domain-containing protein [Ferrimonas]USD37359.1 4Fe-4S dicluster domain-containing protein [Ferrimonas sp. SCSIO 43195]
MSLSRRQFLGCSAACAVTAVISTDASSDADTKVKNLAMIHDETKCIGCRACEHACREVNHVPEGVSRLKLNIDGPFNADEDPYYRFSRDSCQHCQDAPCISVCPTGAAFRDKETGIVDVDPFKCVGCQYCIAACPYRVRFIHPVTKAADKCDFCRKTNLAEGRLPACVEACPTKALTFGDLNDPNSELATILRHQRTERAKLDLGTNPKLFRIPSQKAGVL